MDIAIIGGGAAGLAVGIFAARRLAGAAGGLPAAGGARASVEVAPAEGTDTPSRCRGESAAKSQPSDGSESPVDPPAGRASIVILDGARKLGAKILVAGGARCNVTNKAVTPADFCGGSRNVVKRILAAFPESAAVEFFREIGVALHEEEHGKLFPDTHSARTVLHALLAEAERLGVGILADHRVTAIERRDDGFCLATSHGPLLARRVVLATGGMSLPKTGSDGFGYRLAVGLGHTLVPTTPGLDPLLLAGGFHVPLSGIAQEVELTIEPVDARPVRSLTLDTAARSKGQAVAALKGELTGKGVGANPVRVRGAMLWTHFGVSGPAVLDVSRHWHRSRLEGRQVAVFANFLPGDDFASAERKLLDLAGLRPTAQLHNALSSLLPARVAGALLAELGLDGSLPMAHLPREQRRKLVHALTAWPLPVTGGRGYGFAEVTAGGVPLSEIDPATMASRKCPGLYLVGEILDVDGRIGGFNFQWAWSSGFVAAVGLAAALTRDPSPPDPSLRSG